MTHNHETVRTYCSLSGGPDVENLTGDIWEAVISSLRAGQFIEGSSLGLYIFGIARNKISDYIKKRKRIFDRIPESFQDISLEVEDRIERKQMAKRLLNEIRKSDSKCTKVLFLYYYRSLSVSEITQRVNLPPSKVSEQKNYTLKK